jgi:hypothetical protein
MQKQLEEEQVERIQRGTITKLALCIINLLIPETKVAPVRDYKARFWVTVDGEGFISLTNKY